MIVAHLVYVALAFLVAGLYRSITVNAGRLDKKMFTRRSLQYNILKGLFYVYLAIGTFVQNYDGGNENIIRVVASYTICVALIEGLEKLIDTEAIYKSKNIESRK